MTAPETPYRERLVAATHGHTIAPAQLPALWTAVAAFEHLPTGVYPSPCAYNGSSSQPGFNPSNWPDRAKWAFGAKAWRVEQREVLGRRVDLPTTAIDYPLTTADRERAPWLWQMNHVLPILMESVQARYASPSQYRALKEVAFAWKPTDYYEASVRNRALRVDSRIGPRNADWVDAVVRLALENPSAPYNDLDRYGISDLYVCCEDTYDLEQIVHVAHIVILQNTKRPDVAVDAALGLTKLATMKASSYNRELKPLQTATAMMAISRWAVDPQVAPSSRYLWFAGAISQMVPDPPFVLDREVFNTRRDVLDRSPEVASALAAFEAWWAGRQSQFEQQAAKERFLWNVVAAKIGRAVK